MSEGSAVLLAALALVTAVYLATPVDRKDRGFDGDGKFYAAMAGEKSFDPSMRFFAPYCWRVLTPFLASLLPFSTIGDFLLLAFLANWLTLVLFYWTLRRVDFSAGAAGIGLLLYAGVFWAVKFTFYMPAYIDFLTQLFIVGIYFLLAGGSYGAVIPVMALGVLQKESILLMAPVAWVHFARGRGWLTRGSLGYLLGLLAPALAVLAVPRALIRPLNEFPLSEMFATLRYVGMAEFWKRFSGELFSGLGLLPAMLISRPSGTASAFAREKHCLVAVAIGAVVVFSGYDKSRLFLFMLPAAVIAAARLLRHEREALGTARFRAWLAVTLLLHLYLGHQLSPIRDDREVVARMIPIYAEGSNYVPYIFLDLAVLGLWCAATAVLRIGARGAGERGRTGSRGDRGT